MSAMRFSFLRDLIFTLIFASGFSHASVDFFCESSWVVAYAGASSSAGNDEYYEERYTPLLSPVPCTVGYNFSGSDSGTGNQAAAHASLSSQYSLTGNSYTFNMSGDVYASASQHAVGLQDSSLSYVYAAGAEAVSFHNIQITADVPLQYELAVNVIDRGANGGGGYYDGVFAQIGGQEYWLGEDNDSGLLQTFHLSGNTISQFNLYGVSSILLIGGADAATYLGLFQSGYVDSEYSKSYVDNGAYWEATLTVTPVPVPASIWLFGTSLAGLVVRRRL